jgi:uncharacterized protein (TIGR02680 family)
VSARPLPQPERERWQPLRTGLVDVFYYDQEEFRFRDGRLLLRGNNGTGKSKVLALTLPFLLDGELSPHRVEPDADPKKRMEWNLLLGGEHPNEERLGYTWLELGRRDPDGDVHFCTLGCGLKAVSGRGIVAHWFFLSDQRVGEELALVDSARIALTRERLEEAIGARGAVHRTASAYRRAVDETLFGLGEQRYGALIDLLIKIRAPQLSKRPNERALSDALTGALPPLDQALIADVAEAFRGLEEDRAALTAMVEARDAAERYLSTYRDYARIACRRRAAPPRQAQTAFDRVSRELAEAEAAQQKAVGELQEAQAALAALQAEEQRLRVRERALRESPEARSARELERAAEEARATAERAGQARTLHERGGELLEHRRRRLGEVRDRAAGAGDALVQARAATVEQALTAGIATAFAEQVDGPIGAASTAESAAGGESVAGDEGSTGDDATAEGPGAPAHGVELAELRRRAQELADRQQRAIDHLGKLFAVLADRQAALLNARQHHEERANEATALAAQREQAAGLLERTAGELVGSARAYLEQARALALADPAQAIAKLELWAETLNGPNPLTEALAAAARAAIGAFARAEADLDAQEGDANRLAEELDASIERLRSGEHELPPVPHTREPSTREQRAGAPLWLLVDFRAEVPEQRRAAIEAALEASGILDAWVSPGGELLAPGTHDVLLSPEEDGTQDGARGGARTPRLHEVLEPVIDGEDPHAGQVGVEAVQRVLAAVGLAQDEGTVWVTPEGEFRNGVLRGAWRKPAAAFIGSGAREAARRARLAELSERREQVRRRLAELAAERARLAERRTEFEDELARMPADEALRDAHAVLVGLEAEQRRLAERIASASARLSEAERERAQAEQALRESAHELGLPQEREPLDRMRLALQALRVALAGLWPAYEACELAQGAVAEAGADAETAAREHAEQGRHLQDADREAADRKEHHATLADTVGAAVAELQRQLADVAKSLRENERVRHEADARRSRALQDEGEARGRCRGLTGELEQATARRRADVEALRRFAGTGLIAVALDDVELPEEEDEWSVRAALRVARQIESALAEVAEDEPAWQRAQRRVTDELGALGDALRRHGNNASANLQEEGIVVEVVFRGRSTTVPELASALAQEVADRERLLDEREREILENHLVNEVASTLQELISDAEQRVAESNTELAERPTSTGMQLRLSWRILEDGPPGLQEARGRLLRQAADAWSQEDRAAVGAFLHAQIHDVRSRDLGGTWIEQLTEALDYRAWHRFAIERHQGGRWRSATGPASGGERVLTASMPLFAAASSYYGSAGNANAPRMVMLDEAFAGVDDDARAKCLGLLAAFDLDVVMTSEREWGCYREVPGLAIAQLARVQDIPAVLVSHWEWDGATRTAVERPASDVSASGVLAERPEAV